MIGQLVHLGQPLASYPGPIPDPSRGLGTRLGQPHVGDDVEQSDRAVLLAAAELAYRRNTRPFPLPLVKWLD